jgi:DNA-binding SARP family transcriptional activator
LAFLALGRGRYFPRAEITQAVWGDADNEVGHGSLSTGLWRLRRIIEHEPAKPGDFLVVNRQGAVGLNGPAPVSLDVTEFEQRTRAPLSKLLPDIADSDVASLTAAVELYKDKVLVDFTSEWVLRERERLRRIYLDALGRLMQLMAVRRDYGAAIRYGQSILYADCLREDVHRDLMRYFVLNGQRALALRQFETCRATLKRELAIAPMRETTAVYQRIADSALGDVRLESTSGSQEWQAQHAPSPPQVAVAPVTAAEHIAAARSLIAEADSHLQLSLGLFER